MTLQRKDPQRGTAGLGISSFRSRIDSPENKPSNAELMCLAAGDALSAQGALKAATYESDGVTKLSLSVIADRVLALRQPPKKRKAPKERDTPYRGGAAAFDDSIPFEAA
jgi:hypothetical protein